MRTDDWIAPSPLLHGRSPDGIWWDELENALARLGTVPTARRAVDPADICRRVAVFFGLDVDTDVTAWRPSHGDLGWHTLRTDPFELVGREAWGLAPRGHDAATLLAYSLGVPDAAAEVERRFRADLDSDDGVVAQLAVLAGLLAGADRGEHLHLVPAIHQRVDRLIGRATRARPARSASARAAHEGLLLSST
ncbi:MAG: hypothetical protein P0Y60_15070 [Candidatus Microbacterium colombiense]|nr:MAG: hypothetical protein P0Y60_15070 [Microbacterium sp.]